MAKRWTMATMAVMAMAVVPSAAQARFRPAMVFPAPIAAPASLYLLPGGVYYQRAPDLDVFFADGFWWSAWDGGWYRAESYEGPWELVGTAYVPSEVRFLPQQVPVLLPRAEMVPWGRWGEARYDRGGRYGRGIGWERGGRDDRGIGWERRERPVEPRYARDRRGGGAGFSREPQGGSGFGGERRGGGHGIDRMGPDRGGFGGHGRVGAGDRGDARGGGRSGPAQRMGGGRR